MREEEDEKKKNNQRGQTNIRATQKHSGSERRVNSIRITIILRRALFPQAQRRIQYALQSGASKRKRRIPKDKEALSDGRREYQINSSVIHYRGVLVSRVLSECVIYLFLSSLTAYRTRDQINIAVDRSRE